MFVNLRKIDKLNISKFSENCELKENWGIEYLEI